MRTMLGAAVRSIVAVAMALVLAFTATAACIAESLTAEKAGACMAAMDHRGGDLALEQDCCAVGAPASYPATGPLQVALAAPPVAATT